MAKKKTKKKAKRNTAKNTVPKKHNGGDLKPAWKPGESGNPNGRPRGAVSLLTKLKNAIRQEVRDGLTAEDIINAALLKRAAKGDLKAIQLVFDLIEGPQKQVHEVSHKVATFTDFVAELPEGDDERS